MKVILRKDFESLGKVGDVVTVKDGYARNFLIPQGIALKADKSNIKRLEAETKHQELKQNKGTGNIYNSD